MTAKLLTPADVCALCGCKSRMAFAKMRQAGAVGFGNPSKYSQCTGTNAHQVASSCTVTHTKTRQSLSADVAVARLVLLGAAVTMGVAA